MCTAVRFFAGETYFGRTLDYHRSFREAVVLMPRRYPLCLADGRVDSHYAVLGMAADLSFSGGYPLFYDGVNEKGLAMAGLNFVESAVYADAAAEGRSLAVHEVIPYLLGTCSSLAEAKEALSGIRITGAPFCTPDGDEIPAARLHWMIADETGACAVESVAEGIRIYENPLGVLANEPPFPLQLAAWERQGEHTHLPSDVSSPSRFLRAAEAVRHAYAEGAERDGAEAFFRIMETVTLPWEGSIRENGERWFTLYTCGMSLREGKYFCVPRGRGQMLLASIADHDKNANSCSVCYSL